MRKKQRLGLHCEWVVKEKRGESWVEVLRKSNVFTDDGLNALVQAFGGSYTPPTFLVLDDFAGALQASYSPGATSIQTDVQVHLAGDTKLVLGPETANKETVTFTGPTGSGPYTYTVSATVNSHTSGDKVVRDVKQADDLSTVQDEIQYDATTFPSKRMPSVGGFLAGTGIFTLQFYLTGNQAISYLGNVGLSENDTVGSGSLHDHLTLGYDHAANVDVEIDVTITITNA